jgi:hypothetical protein
MAERETSLARDIAGSVVAGVVAFGVLEVAPRVINTPDRRLAVASGGALVTAELLRRVRKSSRRRA